MADHVDPQILTIEVGTVGCQVSTISISGVVTDSEFNKIEFIYPYTGGIELDPELLWNTIRKTIMVVASRSRLNYGQLAAICCSSGLDGMIPVDAEGNALKYASIWNDWRVKKGQFSVFRGWKSSAGMSIKKIKQWAKIQAGEGSPELQEPAVQLLLFKELYPELYQKTYKFINILDYIDHKLTGRFVTTPDSRLIDWIMDSRNSMLEAFSHDLLRDHGIDQDKLNEVVPNSAPIGELLPELAEMTRLPAGTRVVAGGMSGVTSIIGAGAVDDFQPIYYLGSSSWIETHLPEGNWQSGGLIQLAPAAVPGKQIISAYQSAATLNLNYLRDKVFYAVDELGASIPPEDTFQIMDRMATKAPPGCNGLMYIPILKGVIGYPGEDHRGAMLINLTPNHSRTDIVRSVMEGVALNTRHILYTYEKSIGRKFTRLNMAGGGARSVVWCQIFADVLNIPMRQISDPGNVNSRGAAILAAVGLGYLSFEDVPRIIQYQLVFSPREENREVYDQLYKNYVGYFRGIEH